MVDLETAQTSGEESRPTRTMDKLIGARRPKNKKAMLRHKKGNELPIAREYLEALGNQLVEALRQIRTGAALVWPGWQPTSTPVVIRTAAGLRLRLASRTSAGKLARTWWLSAGLDARVVRKVPGGPARRQFYAAANRENGEVYIEISEPAMAPFPFDEWVAVLGHELFHCYQLAHPRWAPLFRKAAAKRRAIVRLHSLYARAGWLRDNIDEQLRLAKKILQSRGAPRAALAALLDCRLARSAALRVLSPQLDMADRAAEVVEGAARFVETGLIEQMTPRQRTPVPRGLQVSDNRYYLATGNAILRILERGRLPWQDRLFVDGLDHLLEELIARARTAPRPRSPQVR